MACANHPDVPDATLCDQCRRPFCEDCYVVVAGRALCGACKQDAVRKLERGEPLSSQQRAPSPWERERSFKSFKATLKLALFKPQEFYSGLDQHGTGASYLGYAVLVAWPATFIGQVAWLGLQALMMVTISGGQGEGVAAALMTFGFMAALYFVMTPIGILMQVFFGGLITHLCLKLVGGANLSLETSMRTIAYAQSAQIFNFVPLLGALVAWGWTLVLQIVGLKEMHETDYARAVAAVFLPMLVCCLLMVPFVVLMIALSRFNG